MARHAQTPKLGDKSGSSNPDELNPKEFLALKGVKFPQATRAIRSNSSRASDPLGHTCDRSLAPQRVSLSGWKRAYRF